MTRSMKPLRYRVELQLRYWLVDVFFRRIDLVPREKLLEAQERPCGRSLGFVLASPQSFYFVAFHREPLSSSKEYNGQSESA